MCQAYEAERNYICSLENRASIEGFRDAYNGKPNNPYTGPWDDYQHDAYKHGVACYKSKTFPWAIEKQLSYDDQTLVRTEFKMTGQINDKVKKIIGIK